MTFPGSPPKPRRLLRAMLGDALRRTRLSQGRTLADVARAARVSMPYLSELERGRKEASSEVLAAVCDALRVELPDLLAEVAGAARGLADALGGGLSSGLGGGPADRNAESAADGQPTEAEVIGLGRAGEGYAVASPAPGSGNDSPVCLLAA